MSAIVAVGRGVGLQPHIDETLFDDILQFEGEFSLQLGRPSFAFFTLLSRWRVPSKSQQLSLMAIILVLIIKAIDLGISSLVFNALFTLDGS
jgi:hypothetical protein